MVDFTEQFDAIGIDDLRAGNTTKWTARPGSIGAWIAELDFPLAAPVEKAIIDLVKAGTVAYSPASDISELGRAYSEFAQRHWGWSPDPSMVQPIPDVLAGLQSVIERYTSPGTPVVLPTPAYMPFLTLPTYFGREVIQVPLVQEAGADRSGGEQGSGEQPGRYVYDLDALAAAFDTGAELLILCNPHNPVGRVLERDELLAIADVVESKNALVFSDEIHAPLVYEGHRHIPYASLDSRTAAHTITSTSASKAFNLPGLKCAQIVFTNPVHAAKWAIAGRWIGASRPGIFANIAAYDEGEEWLGGVVAYLDRNRRRLAELVAEQLPGVKYRMPEGTYLALLDFREVDRGALGDDPSVRIAERGNVLLTPGPACGDAAKGFARLNFGTPLPVLEEIVRGIATAL